MSNSTSPHTVYAIGLGIRIPDHLTLEALEALQRCARLFSILPSTMLSPLPSGITAKVESLEPYYVPGDLRQDAYQRQISTILDACMRESPVGYVTAGNPVFFDSVTDGLRVECEHRGIGFRIVAGVSSIDAILVDLCRDVAPGLQILEASSLLAFEIEPRTDLPAIVMQPNVFGTSFVVAHRQISATAMEPLREYLLRYYPPDHLVTYVTSAIRSDENSELVQFPLAELGGTEEQPQPPGASLYIPPARPLAQNQAFLQRMADAEGYQRSFQ